MLDLIAAGRLRLTVGAGYRAAEYEQFDLDIKRRPSLMEDGVEVLKQAWTGEPFEYRGHTVRILPRPAQRPRPEIALGGSSPAAAKRAGAHRRRLPARGAEALRHLPRGARRARQAGSTAEARRTWRRHVLPHRRGSRPRVGRRSRRTPCTRPTTTPSGQRACAGRPTPSFDSADELRESGMYEIVTPEDAVDLVRARGGVSFKPLMGGLDPESDGSRCTCSSRRSSRSCAVHRAKRHERRAVDVPRHRDGPELRRDPRPARPPLRLPCAARQRGARHRVSSGAAA